MVRSTGSPSRFDSAACFAALLGDAENGRWKIAPKDDARITRCYRDGTLVLETRFETSEGAVTLLDCMGRRRPRSAGQGRARQCSAQNGKFGAPKQQSPGAKQHPTISSRPVFSDGTP
jgi:hypothetical protein